MKTVKYSCEMCGHSEKMKWHNFIIIFLKNILITIGLIFILYVGYLYYYGGMTSLGELRDNSISFGYTAFAVRHSKELRDIALELSYPCDGGHSGCYAEAIHNNLVDLRYVPSERYRILYHPLYVLKNGGDCRNTASLYSSLMLSLGFDAWVDCDIDYQHCVSIVAINTNTNKEYTEIALSDISNSFFIVIDKDLDFWAEYYE